MIEATGRNLRSLEKAKGIELGQFDSIVGEEDLTTKSYRIPKSSLFVVASVFYTDESMGTDSNRDSVSLQLSIQREAKRDLLNSVQYAEAEVMSPNLDVARVSTLVRIGKRSLIFVMQCDKKVRTK